MLKTEVMDYAEQARKAGLDMVTLIMANGRRETFRFHQEEQFINMLKEEMKETPIDIVLDYHGVLDTVKPTKQLCDEYKNVACCSFVKRDSKFREKAF